MSSSANDIAQVIDQYVDIFDRPEAREASKQLLKSYFTALRGRDLEGIGEYLDEAMVMQIPFGESGKTDEGSYRVYRGRQSVLDFWSVAFKAEGKIHPWSEGEMTMNGDGSRIFFEWRGHVTMTNGTEYRNRYVMRVDIRDGKLVHCKEYYNPIQSAFAFQRPIAGKILIESL